MPSGRSIAEFVVKFLVIYGALAASWPLCGSAYASFLRESGKVLFEAVGPHDHIRIRPATPSEDLKDTVLAVRVANDKETGQITFKQITISSWMFGFQSTSILIGLVAATPVSKRRRVWALFAGLVIIHAFVLARLATFVILWPFVRPDTFWTKALRWSELGFVHGQAVSCFMPVLIWIAVTLRREDARRLLAPTPNLATPDAS